MNSQEIERAINEAVQRQMGQLVIDQIAARVNEKVLQDRIAELESQKDSPPSAP